MKSHATLWKQFDKVFAEADKLWVEADRLMQETPEHTISSEAHHVRFKATTFWERMRLAWYFNGLALKVLWRGQANLLFKRAKSNVKNN